MSMYFRENGVLYEPEYERPGRTKQSFKDSCDINKILKKAQKAGSISHFEKHGAFYGDFAEAPKDLFEAREQIERGTAIFNEAPAEIRKEFKNDPLEFYKFVNDPANSDRLREILPAIAEPGTYFPDVSAATPPGALRGAPSEPSASVSPSSPEIGDSGASEAPKSSE